MSSKISLLISMIFFALFFLLSIDVMCIQYNLSSIDNISVVVGYNISQTGRTDTTFINELENKYNVEIIEVSSSKPVFGDLVSFTIKRDYKPIIVSSNVLPLKIKRSTVVGYY